MDIELLQMKRRKVEWGGEGDKNKEWRCVICMMNVIGTYSKHGPIKKKFFHIYYICNSKRSKDRGRACNVLLFCHWSKERGASAHHPCGTWCQSRRPNSSLHVQSYFCDSGFLLLSTCYKPWTALGTQNTMSHSIFRFFQMKRQRLCKGDHCPKSEAILI